jgi:16S rRNA (guanine527-N7)-methyltransferase
MTDRDAFHSRHPVSRETTERLDAFAATLLKWSGAINLVAPSTLPQLWTRHILDSAQVFDLSPVRSGLWADIGSGAGFPGMIAAILAADVAPGLAFHFVESDHRKAAFLSACARACGISPTIHATRAEIAAPIGAQVLSARALAPLPRLLSLAQRHLRPDGHAIFPKGARAADEITAALETWRFAYDKHPSITDPDSVILLVREIQHA